MTPTLLTAEILRRGARQVREGWWPQCRWSRHEFLTRRVCALGALENAVVGRRLADVSLPHSMWADDSWEAVVVLAGVINLLQQQSGVESTTIITEWNNAPQQTAEAVAALMEVAALSYELDQVTA